MKSRACLALAGFILCPPAARAFNVSIGAASLGMPADAGHEEIAGQALEDVVRADAALADVLDPAAVELITRGNYATDMPNGVYPVDLNEYWGFPVDTDWNNPQGQDLHFLRDYDGATTVSSAYATCMAARERILHLSADVAKLWGADREKALFLMGHATHIIQDSFSPAHVVRASKDENSDLEDVCYYPVGIGPTTPSAPICFHQTVDARDRIWLTADDPAEVERNRKEWGDGGEGVETVEDLTKFDLNDLTAEGRRSHLKNGARLARAATAKYVLLMLSEIRKRAQDTVYDADGKLLAERLTNRMLEGGEDVGGLGALMPKGIMRCDGLSRASVTLTHKPTPPLSAIRERLYVPAW